MSVHPTTQAASTVISQDTAGSNAALHSPLPWALLQSWPQKIVHVSDVLKGAGGSIYEDDDRRQFAVVIAEAQSNRYTGFGHEISSEVQKANAAFIVKAVNNHDALVKALEAVAAAKMPGEARRIAVEALRAINQPA